MHLPATCAKRVRKLPKFTWPTREEVFRLTWIVFVVTVISAIVLFGIDTFFSTIIAFILDLGG